MMGAPHTVESRQRQVDSLYHTLSSTQKSNVCRPSYSDVSRLSDEQIITQAALASVRCNVKALMSGDWSGYPSQSEADLALCSSLAKVTGLPETIDRIFRSSGLMRDKWDEMRGKQTYGEMTINEVLNKTGSTLSNGGGEAASQYAIAQVVIKEVGRENLLFTNQFWRWDSRGIWRPADDRELKQVIHQVADHGKLNRSRVDSILDLIKTEVHSVNHCFDTNTRAINCLNGELHYIAGKWELHQHDRDNYFTQQIPVAYDKEAKPERFIAFMREIFSPDHDWLQKCLLVQEFMGYALCVSCEYERFLLLVGQGANGKSVLLKTLEALAGPSNVSGVQPSQFENRFQLAHLQGKLANIITEIPQGAVIADAKLKAIVSGELMTAEQKHRPPFDFRPFATMFFATNHMPHTQDFSSAFFRRAEVIAFNRRFAAEERDVHLKEKLLDELPGILNLALAGLKRLYDVGDFTRLPSSEEAKVEWERDADQVFSFVDEECDLTPEGECIVSELYRLYTNWTISSGIARRVNVQNFTTRLVRLGCERKKGAKGIRMIIGIRHRSG